MLIAVYLPPFSQMCLWHVINSLIEKAKTIGLGGDQRGLQMGRTQLPKAASCQSANKETGKYVCCWHLSLPFVSGVSFSIVCLLNI